MAIYLEEFKDDKGFIYRLAREVSLMNLETFDTINNDKIYTSYDEVEKNHVLIDREISIIIKLLNRKGYYTLNSCEGHLDIPTNIEYSNIGSNISINDLIIRSSTYIMFDLDRIIKNHPPFKKKLLKFLKDLPNLFYILYDNNYYKLENNKKYLENKLKFLSNSKDKRVLSIYTYFDEEEDLAKFYSYKKEALLKLFSFALDLPDIS